MGLLRMLGLVRLSEYEAVCRALDGSTETLHRANNLNERLRVANKQWESWNEQRSARIATLTEANDRLAAKVSELSEALERKGHPLSWPSVTEPEPAVRVRNWLEGDRG